MYITRLLSAIGVCCVFYIVVKTGFDQSGENAGSRDEPVEDRKRAAGAWPDVQLSLRDVRVNRSEAASRFCGEEVFEELTYAVPFNDVGAGDDNRLKVTAIAHQRFTVLPTSDITGGQSGIVHTTAVWERLEDGDLAVLLMEELGGEVAVPKKELPLGSEINDWFDVQLEHDGCAVLTFNPQKTNREQERTEMLMQQMKQRSD